MDIKISHMWNLNPREAIKLQEELSNSLVLEDKFDEIRIIAGFDVGIRKRKATENKLKGIGACVVMSYSDLEIIEEHVVVSDVDYPYIPGLLSFREIPILIPVIKKIKHEPDILIMDGQGIAHPRRFGLASHIGVILNKPSIGCAKSNLIGDYKEPDAEVGSYRYIYHEDDVIGAAVRTKNGVKPVYVSPGYRITLDTAISIILSCCKRYRLPEPIRKAHELTRGEV